MKQTDQQNVPKLRFPGFEGTWSPGTIGSHGIAIIDGDRGANYPKSSDFMEQGACLFLSAKNVTKTGFVFDEMSFISASKDAAMSKGKLSPGDIVLTTRGSLGHVALFSSTVRHRSIRINSGMVLLRTGTENDPAFIYQQLISDRFQREVERMSFGSAQPQLTVTGIKKMPTSVCSLPEQRKIASFLGAVDTKIAQLARKKALLEDYKKGCMQQLFSQQIRFKDDDGQDFPDWEEKRLAEIVILSAGTSKSKYISETGDRFIVDMGSVTSSGQLVCNKRTQLDSDLLEIGDLVMPKDDIGGGNIIGKVGLIDKARTYVLGDHVYRLQVDRQNSTFLAYLINSSSINKSFRRKANGTAQLGLSRASVLKQGISLPHPDEQRKIADFLSAIDRKIELVGKELEHAKTFKKGLLQQMFV